MKEHRDDWSVVVGWKNRTEGRKPRYLLNTALECLVNNEVGVVPGCEELSHPVGLYKKVFYVGGETRSRECSLSFLCVHIINMDLLQVFSLVIFVRQTQLPGEKKINDIT